ncbi:MULTISPECIES: bifunctional 3,4-dihydroxy-2-butanone-4-phosphate synthase/GTP cyclohydrolase II [Caballeronia]|jgi:3,4-dihydroxy 2-butanone 4-phosphate synthase/GTP cyclohydrolase II|uniref:3,4-dihydroxy-2-butanone 4-phosphate synthase n=1 Tax=Caballeronia zhejiangensis TaxID=871203 RepID=A0A656QLG2_9BURK|nr:MULTISPECIES: bifunctional 3,4-dihydroxy-2-butanone-4-phosphate synthase/GTP cyclohydrolase II [Caballeronia]KDR31681.1 3,4-dihydroxy-2-butanone 4-phosphate synthase [Caballeronia zhejiangensis]MCG7402635.1 bifunctional 3,4-dihydroxy-2-butanone-4-phosphate synthase/GTP cyclohydrolase II [Caballeronia zhejiangensis]MCI1044240.1 bifunctional 3,4-dihydroxy-2-butanone-4-phosphate synthase/GTP cyclohydrolase II [Caballeronia zhejiangensis]MDR5764540.1 bifunctional 3,4-dihydroxy-2-butanone-4-phosp
MSLASTPEIIAELKAGRMVILVDEEDRENEGDLVVAAEFVTPEAINFMAKHGRGLICLTLTQERCKQLNLPLMTHRNGTQYGTAFTVSIEAAEGVTTGISAADRAKTIAAAVAHDARAEHIVQPGHVFPIMAQPGGVLVRAGHTEAGCDLTALAGLTPAAVICEIIKDDGEMARLPDLIEFGQQHGIMIGTIADLIHYRSRTESIIEKVCERTMQTAHGPFRALLYRDEPTGSPHIALVRGTPRPDRDTPVRVHEPLSVLDLLEIDSSTHSWTIDAAMKEIAARDLGAIVMLNCGDTKEHLVDVFRAFDQKDKAAELKRRPIDFKTYGIGAQILRDIGVGKMEVLANPRKLGSMSGYGLEVTGFVPMPGCPATAAPADTSITQLRSA